MNVEKILLVRTVLRKYKEQILATPYNDRESAKIWELLNEGILTGSAFDFSTASRDAEQIGTIYPLTPKGRDLYQVYLF